MKELVALARALSEPNRVRILTALRRGELCVCELCDALGLSQSTLSTHLQAIRRTGLVTVRREGRWSYYSLSGEGQRRVESLLAPFEAVLGRDVRLRADARRLERRLALRRDGVCCVGFCAAGRRRGCA